MKKKIRNNDEADKKTKKIKLVLDIAICSISVLIVIVVFSVEVTIRKMQRVYTESKILNSIENDYYGYAIDYCYDNEMKNAHVDEGTKEIMNTVKYMEMSYMSRVYKDSGNIEKYEKTEENRRNASENMGDYSVLTNKFDKAFEK